MNRRRFLSLGLLSTAAFTQSAFTAPQPSQVGSTLDNVHMFYDGLTMNAAEQAAKLREITQKDATSLDVYSTGGVVEQLEKEFAETLGKEKAVFFPTGTFANHYAVRQHCREIDADRVIVPEQCHMNYDSGDCCQRLSGLNLITLAHGEAAYSLEDFKRAIADTADCRVPVSIGAAVLESPCRRTFGTALDLKTITDICNHARKNGIKTHLDGARMFIASAYTGISPAEYARHFDSVYVSLYKYFNAPSGAILAGPASMFEDYAYYRRLFGGGLHQVWPFAAMALHYKRGFIDRLKSAISCSEAVIRSLEQSGLFTINRVSNGTNIFFMKLNSGDAKTFQSRLIDQNILLRQPYEGTFYMQVNETWNRIDPDDISARMITAARL